MWWDDPNEGIVWSAKVFQFGFFILSQVVLMNLLIAMMANTYSTIESNADGEYMMQKAKVR